MMLLLDILNYVAGYADVSAYLHDQRRGSDTFAGGAHSFPMVCQDFRRIELASPGLGAKQVADLVDVIALDPDKVIQVILACVELLSNIAARPPILGDHSIPALIEAADALDALAATELSNVNALDAVRVALWRIGPYLPPYRRVARDAAWWKHGWPKPAEAR